MAREDQMYLYHDFSVLAIEDQEHAKQSIHIVTIYGKEKLSLRATEEEPFNALLTEKELVLEQKHEEYCRTAALHGRKPKTEFSIHNRRILIRASTVQGATQTVASEIFRARDLYLAYNSQIDGHPGRRSM